MTNMRPIANGKTLFASVYNWLLVVELYIKANGSETANFKYF